MSQAIRLILNDKRIRKVADGDAITDFNMVSLIDPKGRYYISRDVRDLFMDEYCRYISKEEAPQVGLAEKPETYIPVLVDVDIKVKETDESDLETCLYTDNHIEFIIRTYQQVLKEIVQGIDDKHLSCFLLEKNPYRVESGSQAYIKNGFHLHFPWIFLSAVDQEIYLIPRVQKIVKDANIFSDLGIEDSGALIDKAVVKNCWLMYGSKKDPNMEAYYNSFVYNHLCEKIPMEEALKGYKIYDVKNSLISISGNEGYYLPRILSIHISNREYYEIKSSVERPVRISKKPKKKNHAPIDDGLTSTERAEESKKLIDMLSANRAEDYQNWITIVWSIYNTFDGDDSGFELAKHFSQKCKDKYDEGAFIHMWENIVPRENGYTIKTLHHYAKIDNPEEYKKYVHSKIKSHINESISGEGTHNDIAKILYRMYGSTYVCASINQDIWYEFDNHGWKRIEAGTTLRARISDVLVEHYTSSIREITNQGTNLGETELLMLKKKVEAMRRIVNNLKSSPFKNNVMKECKEVFYNEKFLRLLDRNKYIIRFKNGIYDLKTHAFRDGLPEDYCSLCLGVDYVEFEESDEKVLQVHDFFMKIFPDVSVREYFIDIASEIFVGGNHQKKIWFWTGAGDNGKSVTETIFEKMMGEYAMKLPTSLFTGKRTQSSGANPELARVGNGQRWVMAQEPGKKEVFNIGICKELSGNDTFYARGLYQEGKEVTPMFKVGIVCNDPPIVPDNDKAFWNRIRLIPFESKFCDDAPESPEEQLRQKRFPIDRSFDDKIPGLLEAFAWYLLNHRKKGLSFIEPEKVRMFTEAYRLRNDIYAQFVQESIMEDAKGSITLSEVYAIFKEWHKESLPNHNIPIKADLKEQLVRRWGEPSVKESRWKGYRIRTTEDNEEDD